jgi:hypothetical protein
MSQWRRIDGQAGEARDLFASAERKRGAPHVTAY